MVDSKIISKKIRIVLMPNVKIQMSNQVQSPNQRKDTLHAGGQARHKDTLHTGGQDKKQTRHNNQYSISETTD
jgi:hypothetical protein